MTLQARRLLLAAWLVGWIFASPLLAREPEGPRRGELRAPHPHLAELRHGIAAPSTSSAVYDPELERLSRVFSSALADQFGDATAVTEAGRFACRGPGFSAIHLRALRTQGAFEECATLAESCGGEPLSAVGELLFEGARCAAAADQFDRAYRLYDLVTGPDQASSPDFQGRVYRFARFALFTQYQDQARGIVVRNPAWAGSPELVLGTMEYLAQGFTRRASPTAIEAEVMQWTRDADPVLRQAAVLGWARHLAVNLYRTRDAVHFLETFLPSLRSPEEWFSLVYWSLFRQKTPNFELARAPYEASLAGLHADSWLPISMNTYTYTQIATAACPGRVTGGPIADEYDAIKSAWLAGALSTDEALRSAQRLDRSSPGKADLLTLMGSLAEALGRDEEARALYWQAHLVCPFYDRSHDGLDAVAGRRYYRAFSDYEVLRTRADAIVRSTSFPPELGAFVLNWATISPEGRERFKYAIRIWANHVGFLQRAGARVYLKPAFQLLSEAPGLGWARDDRVDYEDDNRLWDDVSGVAAGRLSVFGYGSMLEAPFGEYNVAAHEVAHLFHGAAPRAIQECITALYRAAGSRNLFPDPYAAINEAEYFAQGVGYLLTPVDAPPRFGLTVQWLIENDADLYQLLRQIETATDVASIGCPVATG